MTFQRTPWAIGGGALIEPEVMRLLAYASTDKTEGIVDIGDLRVRALAVAGGSVLVGNGGAVIKNRSAGGTAQSYVVRNDGDEQVNVGPTGGAARSDLVVVRIVDPQYSPWPALDPGQDPTTATYVEPFIVTNVPAATTKAMDLNGGAGLGYSAIALARIDIPANTASITDAMIHDLRKMASPRRQRVLNAYTLTAATETNTATGAEGEVFPNQASWAVEIPEWATRARVIGSWVQVIVPPGNASGFFWVRLGYPKPAAGVETRRVNYNTPGSTQSARGTFMAADDIAIPASLRGTVQALHLRAQYTTGSGPDTARLQMNAASAAILDVEFLEAPAEDA